MLLNDFEKTALFLRAMEDENCHSPFFGILALKRLTRVSTRHLSLSRETFKATQRTIVKPNFRLICAEIVENTGGKPIYLRKRKIKLELLAGY
jgi:hypothetical protein